MTNNELALMTLKDSHYLQYNEQREAVYKTDNWELLISTQNTSNNIAICITNTNNTNIKTTQYVYDCNILTPYDVRLINLALSNTLKNGIYNDPFSNDELKHARIE